MKKNQSAKNFVSHRQQCARSCLGIHIAYVLNNIKSDIIIIIIIICS
jgi:hypothetical protein